MLDSMPRANAQVLTLVRNLNPGSNLGSDLCAAKGRAGLGADKSLDFKELWWQQQQLLATKKEE